MNRNRQQTVVGALRELCSRNEGARTFFEWAANRQNNANWTSIDVFERKSGKDRVFCIELAKELGRMGCGKYVVGRRSYKTRFEWGYGLKSLAAAALGRESTLEPVDPALEAELEDGPDDTTTSQAAIRGQTDEWLTIAEAKRRLAISLGVPVDSIDITIRA